MKVPIILKTCSKSTMKQKCETEERSSFSSVDIEGVVAGIKSRSFSAGRSFGAQIHPMTLDPSRQFKFTIIQAQDTLKPVRELNMPRSKQKSGSMAQLKGMLLSCITCTNEENGLPSENKCESEAEVAERRSPLMVDKSVQTEPIEDWILHWPPHRGLRVVFETTPASPPPSCSQCNNEHHSGYCNPPKRFSSEELMGVIGFSLDSIFVFKHDNVYRGELDGCPVFVAMKETEEKSNFISEVNILKYLRHPNIVTLRGYCDDENSRALVFNFVCNGTLFFHLSSGNLKLLQWPHRAKLAVEIARGLVYMHGSNIIHGNISSMNVFVTHDFVPLIGEFSFTTDIEGVRHVIHQDRSEDRNARGYLPPEYEVGRTLSEHLDIYALGVILFELVSGRTAFDRKNRTNHFLGEWGRETVQEFDPKDEGEDQCELLDRMVDPRLKDSEYNKCEMLRMMRVAELCTSKNPKERPLMPMVLDMLIGNIDIERSHAPPSPTVPTRQCQDDHINPVMQAENALLSSDNDQSPSESPHLLRGVNEKSRQNDNFERAQQEQNYPEEGSSSGTPAVSRSGFTIGPWRPSGQYYTRPPSPGHALLRNRSPTHDHGALSGDSGPSMPFLGSSPTNLSSTRLSSPSSSRGIPLSLVRHNGVIRPYIRKSGSAKPQRKGCQVQFENPIETFK